MIFYGLHYMKYKHSKKENFGDLEDAKTNDNELETDEFAKNILIPNSI